MPGSTDRPSPQRRLGPADWAHAALDALARGGVAAVAVEPVAARLGATKGSFYWHFANRDALLGAALELWECRATDDVIARLDAIGDPAQALRQLFDTAFADDASGHVDAALLAQASEPQVAVVLERVTGKRMTWLRSTLERSCLSPTQARRHAVVLYATWTGMVVLRAAVPELVEDAGDASGLRRHVASVLDLGVPPPDPRT